MNPITQLSQRDTRWKDTKLGYGSTTIGGYGCLITALTCLARLDNVSKVNDILKNNQGYTGDNGNLVIWDKVSKIPNLTFKYRYYTYDNDKVKAIIEKNGGCIIEVDGAPIGGYKHWLLYIGNKQLLDPWDGQIKSTSSYTPLSFVDVEYTESPTMDALTECLNQHTLLVDKCNKLDKRIEALTNQVNEQTITIGKKNDEITELKKQMVADGLDIDELAEMAGECLTLEEELIHIHQEPILVSNCINLNNKVLITDVIALFRLWLKGWLK